MAQVGQFPGVPPVGPVAPIGRRAAAARHDARSSPAAELFPRRSREVTTRRGRTVQIPAGQPNRNSFSDRVESCVHAGTAAGIGPNRIGGFTAQWRQLMHEFHYSGLMVRSAASFDPTSS